MIRSDPPLELRLGPSRHAIVVWLLLSLPAWFAILWLPPGVALLVSAILLFSAWQHWQLHVARRRARSQCLIWSPDGWAWQQGDAVAHSLESVEALLLPRFGRCSGRLAGRRWQISWFADAVDPESYRRLRVAASAPSAGPQPASQDNPG